MNIIIIYDSTFGSTKDISEYIGKALSKYEANVTVKYVKDEIVIEKYDAAILGGPIQYDRWSSNLRKFIKSNEHYLKKVPVAYFFTCLVLSKKSTKAYEKSNSYTNNLLKRFPNILPIAIGQFAGVLDLKRAPFFYKFLGMLLYPFLGVKEGDYRDWKQIESWGLETYNLMEKSD